MGTGTHPTGPVLSEGRVTLRPFRADDADCVAESCQDPDIPRFTMMPDRLTPQQAREWIEHRNQLRESGLFALAITADGSDGCVGQMGAFIETAIHRAETFYWVDTLQRRSGIATAALKLMTAWVFAEHTVVRTQLITHPDNVASQRVAAKAGYQREGILRAWEPVKNSQPDVVMWSRLRSDPEPV